MTLAWTPFIDPLPADQYWLWLVLPLVVGVSVVYKALREDDLTRVPRQAAYLSAQVLGFLASVAVLLWLVAEFM